MNRRELLRGLPLATVAASIAPLSMESDTKEQLSIALAKIEKLTEEIELPEDRNRPWLAA